MLKKIIKMSLRNFWKSRKYSIINVIGLGIAITASFFIFLYVNYEKSYDKYNTNIDRIFRLVRHARNGVNQQYTSAPFAIGPAMAQNSPEIEKFTRIWFRDIFVRNENRKFQENIMYADSSLFSVFSFSSLQGSLPNALTEPFSVVLSESASKKYFGSSDAIGKSLLFKDDFSNFSGTVKAVIRDMPLNSSFRADVIVSLTTLTNKLDPEIGNQWEGPMGETFLLLAPGALADNIQAKTGSFLKANESRFTNDEIGQLGFELEPLEKIYLQGKYPSQNSGSRFNVYVFLIIGIFIVIIAAINFINLTTARSLERAKEVGILKSIGSSRTQLIFQFIADSLLIALIAFFLAVILIICLTTPINEIYGKVVLKGIFNSSYPLIVIATLSLLIGLLAGLYPAVVLSKFKPVDVLRGQLKSGSQGIVLRKTLVIVQFTISIFLIIATITVLRQIQYVRSMPLGFKKDLMVVIDFHRNETVKNRLPTIKDELSKIPNVLAASSSSGIPNSGFESANYEIENKVGVMEKISVPLYMVDEDFFKQYQISFIAGRSFAKEFPTDFKEALIINESAAGQLGYKSPKDIIGKRFNGEGSGTVIGVVKNFNFISLHDQISPLIFRTFVPANRYITLSIGAKNIQTTINAIANRWKELVPDSPIDYFFLDEAINKQYNAEVRFGRIFSYFGVLAIFISCLGLLGLTLFSATQRRKEIGIRKVTGASAVNIVILLTRNQVKLVLISMILASPVAWFFMNRWLQTFYYRININWWTFALAGGLSLLVAILTTSILTIRASLANPVNSLRMD